MAANYLKIYDDTVLKLSINQGYEHERTDTSLGNFTMGELIFTRDTARVFCGNYTPSRKNWDSAHAMGGVLVGNKYLGSIEAKQDKTTTADLTSPENRKNTSVDGSKNYWAKYANYNTTLDAYDGDYLFDRKNKSLVLFDKKFGVDEENGFIVLPFYEPDNITISKNENNNLTVKSIPFTSFSAYFDQSNGFYSQGQKIKFELPQKFSIDRNQKNIQLDFTQWQHSTDNDTNTPYILQLKKSNKNIENQYTVHLQKFNTNQMRIRLADGLTARAKNNSETNYISFDTAELSLKTLSDGEMAGVIISHPFPILKQNQNSNLAKDISYYQGTSSFTKNGFYAFSESYFTDILNDSISAISMYDSIGNGLKVIDSNDSNTTTQQIQFIQKTTFPNVGLNYLRQPIKMWSYSSSNQNPTNSVRLLFTTSTPSEGCFGLIREESTTQNTSNISNEHNVVYIPDHAQSVIVQIKNTFVTSNDGNEVALYTARPPYPFEHDENYKLNTWGQLKEPSQTDFQTNEQSNNKQVYYSNHKNSQTLQIPIYRSANVSQVINQSTTTTEYRTSQGGILEIDSESTSFISKNLTLSSDDNDKVFKVITYSYTDDNNDLNQVEINQYYPSQDVDKNGNPCDVVYKSTRTTKPVTISQEDTNKPTQQQEDENTSTIVEEKTHHTIENQQDYITQEEVEETIYEEVEGETIETTQKITQKTTKRYLYKVSTVQTISNTTSTQPEESWDDIQTADIIISEIIEETPHSSGISSITQTVKTYTVNVSDIQKQDIDSYLEKIFDRLKDTPLSELQQIGKPIVSYYDKYIDSTNSDAPVTNITYYNMTQGSVQKTVSKTVSITSQKSYNSTLSGKQFVLGLYSNNAKNVFINLLGYRV